MSSESSKKSIFKRVFDIRLFPMDVARIVNFFVLLVLRIKKVDTEGRRYKGSPRGAAVLAANHIGFSDPHAIYACFPFRRVFCLTAEIAMGGKVRSFFMTGAGCIKVDRNISDIEAVHKVKRVLSGGRLLIIFPQGGLSDPSLGIGELKSGAVLMALQAKVPIIPMYSEKRERFYSRKLFVIGDAIDPSEHIKGRFPSMSEIELVTDILSEKMEECRETYLKLKGKK